MATTGKATGLEVRCTTSHDYARIFWIEAESFHVPWTEEEFRRRVQPADVFKMVVEVQRTRDVAGYMLYRLDTNGFRILKLAVAPEYRFQRMATALIDYLKGKLHPGRRTVIATDVWSQNAAAQLFFRKQGFVAEGRYQFDYGQEKCEAIKFAYSIEECSGK